jgi:hypothetical protein
MEPLEIRPDLVLPPGIVVVSYTRDVGGEPDSAVAARQTASTVELRVRLGEWEALNDDQRAQLAAYDPLNTDRRGTIRVVFGQDRSRRRNLEGARRKFRALVYDALWGPPPVPVVEPPPRGLGLHKGRRTVS